LAAVQALYSAELTGAPVDSVLDDFVRHGIGGMALVAPPDDPMGEVEAPLTEFDGALFALVVRGALARRGELDAMIGGALAGDWTVERLEATLRAILRAGAFELAQLPEIPPKVAISEYVDVAHAFYSGPEPGLVNAVLDRIARSVRAADIG
jgi:N utilization substance protein B